MTRLMALCRRFAVLLVLGLCTPLAAIAQETTTGSLAGEVVDSQDLAVPGATITVGSEQGTRAYVSNSAGRFLVPYLTPGLFTVRVEMQGFVPVEQRDIKVRLGQRLELRFVMQPGAMTEEVTVLAAPIIDHSSSTAGALLDDQLIGSVPVGRRFTDVLYIAPGVNSGGGTGEANASISGGSGLENNYVLDGVNISDVGYGAAGSYSTQHGTPGNAIVFDFIKEIEVKTAGFEAEFGQSTGGIVNVITKSGTNAFKGSVFTYLQPETLSSERERITTRNGTVNATGATDKEGGFTLGGPLVKDRLFFFAAADLQHERVSFEAPAGFPLASLGEVPRKRRTLSYATKATYQMSTAHRVEASFFGDPSEGESGPQRSSALRGVDLSAFSDIRYGGHYQTVRYDGMLSPRWLVEASVSRSDSKVRERPAVDEWRVTDTTVVPNVITGGIGGYDVEQGGTRNAYQLKSTHNLGRHQIRYGVLLEDITFDSENQSTGPPVVLPTGQRTATAGVVRILPDPVFGKVYAMQGARTANVRATTQTYLSLFAQDTIKVGSRLTLRPGLRWEQQELTGVGGGYTFTGNWSPRVGATLDPTGSGRSKVFANFGRFYTQFPNDLAARGFTALASHQADYFDAALTRPIPDGVLAAGTAIHYRPSGANPADVIPGSESTYIQEWLAGGEYEVVRGLSLGLRYIHRDLRNVLEDMAPAAAILYDQGIARGIEFVIGNPRDGFPATLNNIGAFETPVHRYDAVELTVDRRFANRWAMQASYRWSRLFGNYEGFYRNDNNQSDPGLTSLYDLPINDPTYTEIGVPSFRYRGDIRFLGRLGNGPLPTDRPHQAKLFGNYRFDMGLNIGVGLQGSSGVPLTAFAASPTTGNAGNIPEGPRGSGIETVDGFKRRTPAEFSVDLHVDHPISLGAGRLMLLADLFNVLNSQAVTNYDYRTENRIRVPNPDYGARTALQLPRQLRVGVRYEF
jgi:hypothetical protein